MRYWIILLVLFLNIVTLSIMCAVELQVYYITQDIYDSIQHNHSIHNRQFDDKVQQSKILVANYNDSSSDFTHGMFFS